MPTRRLVTSYPEDLRIFPNLWHKVGLALAAMVIAAWPVLASARWLGVANLALVAVVGAAALMMLTGFAGQISLGHAAFLALGAYTVAILGERLHAPFWLTLPAAGAVAAAVGLAAGSFALRLKGLYLAIVTIGLLFLVHHVLFAFPSLTHGPAGIAVPLYPWFEGKPLPRLELSLYVLFLALAGAAALAAKNVARSNTGRAMMAVRDNDLAASVLGVNPARAKILSFGLSSFFAGVAGGMFAYQQQYITVEPPFDLNMSVQYIAMIVLGGLGTVFGAVAGALTFVMLSPIAEEVGRRLPVLSGLSSAQQSTLVFSVIVAAFLVFEPLGLFGIWLRIKRYFVAWPFRY